jgi:hypothetical protein
LEYLNIWDTSTSMNGWGDTTKIYYTYSATGKCVQEASSRRIKKYTYYLNDSVKSIVTKKLIFNNTWELEDSLIYQYTPFGRLRLVDIFEVQGVHYRDTFALSNNGNTVVITGTIVNGTTYQNRKRYTINYRTPVATQAIAQNNLLYTLFPNPTEGKLFFKPNEMLSDAKISIFTLYGQQVYSKLFINFEEQENIDIENLPKGLYLFCLENKDIKVTQKILLE